MDLSRPEWLICDGWERPLHTCITGWLGALEYVT